MRDIVALKKKIRKISKKLFETYPEATCSLDYQKPLQLLIATILAAQCTDRRVNIVTKELFQKYESVEDFANVNIEELEQAIKSTGFYRNKAKNIIACCNKLIKEHGGKVPDSMEALTALPGVGRKTANVILSNIYGIPGVIVDTHCIRLSNRIGLTEQEDPVKIEQELMEIIPRKDWAKFSNNLVYHGRAICDAKKPRCELCPISGDCKYFVKGLSKN
ncbi:MAG: endonuclease III [Lutisporaceae bacterium]